MVLAPERATGGPCVPVVCACIMVAPAVANWAVWVGGPGQDGPLMLGVALLFVLHASQMPAGDAPYGRVCANARRVCHGVPLRVIDSHCKVTHAQSSLTRLHRVTMDRLAPAPLHVRRRRILCRGPRLWVGNQRGSTAFGGGGEGMGGKTWFEISSPVFILFASSYLARR